MKHMAVRWRLRACFDIHICPCRATRPTPFQRTRANRLYADVEQRCPRRTGDLPVEWRQRAFLPSDSTLDKMYSFRQWSWWPGGPSATSQLSTLPSMDLTQSSRVCFRAQGKRCRNGRRLERKTSQAFTKQPWFRQDLPRKVC